MGNASSPSAAHPARDVLAEFGAHGDPLALPGGEGLTFRVGDVVVKRVHDVEEAAWTQGLVSRVRQRGFRLPDPIATGRGAWVYEGWVASRFLRGLRPAAPDWDLVTAAGLLFADAAESVRDRGDVLSRRTHRWAVADRVAWGEDRIDLPREASKVCDGISILLDTPAPERHFVHADLSGNVYLDHAGVPVVLDVSPCLRPRRWAAAIVVADAVLWYGADAALATRFASDPADRDLFARAMMFRMVAEQLASDPRHGASLEPYRDVLATMT